MNYRIIAHTLGWVINFEAASMLFPMICALIYGEQCWLVFAVSAVLCLLIGCSLTFKTPKKKSMYAKEGFLIVAFSWIVISILGALPFFLSGHIPDFTDALFETVSGFTTTGATILSDVEALPKSLLFWRSFTHWIGGMGVLVFLVAVLPLAGGDNFQLMRAESPGPSVSKLVPRVGASAKILYGIYAIMTVMQIIFLLAGGMNLFDAITMSFGTAGTGGFGIKNSSAAEYSPYIQNVITVFMILFGIDFSLYYLILMKRYKGAFSSTEARTYLGIIIVSAVVICINVRPLFGSVSEALRHSLFQVGSIITTTGFATDDFDKWPEFSKTVLVVLMFVGACAGSTGGGIKVSRVIILFKSIIKELKITAHPKSTHKVTMNGRIIEHETLRAVNVFVVAYVVIYAVSVLIISMDNFGFTTNFTAVAATINNVGPGLEKVGPVMNFSIYSPISKLVLIFDMLAGRLEIFPMLILLSPYTWRK